MAKIPKPRRPGQTGNWSGQGRNAQAFNARQRSGKSKGCAIVMISVGLLGIAAMVGGFGVISIVL